MTKRVYWNLTIATALPTVGIFVFWFLGIWKLMIVCVIFSSIIWFINPRLGFYNKTTLKGHLLNILITLPLVIYAYARLYEVEGLLLNGQTVHSIKTALYFSIVTLTTLGYGDYQPSECVQMWAATQALYGYILLAMLVGLAIELRSNSE